MATTTRWGFDVSTGPSLPDIVHYLEDIHARAEAIGSGFMRGTLAARPAAATANAGFIYQVTDAVRPRVDFSTGSAWVTPEALIRTITDVVSPGFAPVDGDVAYLHFVVGGSLSKDWQLKYIAGRPIRKWEPLGFSEVVYEDLAGGPFDATPGLGVSVALAAMPIPAPGRYRCQFSALAQRVSGTIAQPSLRMKAWPGTGLTVYRNADPTDSIVVLSGSDNIARISGEAVFTATGTGQVDLDHFNNGGDGTSRLTQIRASLRPLELGT